MVTITVRSAAQAARLGSLFGLMAEEVWEEFAPVRFVPHGVADAQAVAAHGLCLMADDGSVAFHGDADIIALAPRRPCNATIQGQG